jgi:hypothetical protein
MLEDKYIIKSGAYAGYIELPGLMDAINNYNNENKHNCEQLLKTKNENGQIKNDIYFQKKKIKMKNIKKSKIKKKQNKKRQMKK